MDENNNKIKSIIILRGIAALSVCFVHVGIVTNFHVNRLIDFIIMNGQQGVAIFFVISGFIMPYSLYKKGYQLNNFFAFLIRRSVRIDPPYWCTIALLFLIGGLPISLLNLKSIILHIFYLVPFVKGAVWYSSIFWTLSIEFQFYILLGLFYPILNKINPNISIACLILVSAICVFMKFTYRGIIISNLYDFVIGYIVFLGFINKVTKNKTIIILVLFAVFLAFAVSYTTAIVPLLSALFIIFYKNDKLPGYVSFTGNISYSLYLVHLPVSSFFAFQMHRFITNNFLLFPLCIAVSILFAYVFYRLVEKPSMDLSRNIKKIKFFKSPISGN